MRLRCKGCQKGKAGYSRVAEDTPSGQGEEPDVFRYMASPTYQGPSDSQKYQAVISRVEKTYKLVT
jgi:hypothetical protein